MPHGTAGERPAFAAMLDRALDIQSFSGGRLSCCPNKIREAIASKYKAVQLSGIVEVGGAYFGGPIG